MRLSVPTRCKECEGCGRVWSLLKGANISETVPCNWCGGVGIHYKQIYLSKTEIASIRKIESNHGVTGI